MTDKNKNILGDDENRAHNELSVGAVGYFMRFMRDINSGKSLTEIVAEIKEESDMDDTKRSLLGDAIMFVIKLLPNPGAQSEKKKKDE